MKSSIATALACTLVLCSNLVAATPQSFPSSFPLETIKRGELLVKFKQRQQTFLDDLKRKYSANSGEWLAKPSNLGKWSLIKLPDTQDFQETWNALSQDPNIEMVIPNLPITPSAIPSDEYYAGTQWHLNNVGQAIREGQPDEYFGTPGADIDAQRAWDIRTDASEIVVAVVDTGVYASHSDLTDNIWINSGEIAGNGIDDDANGFVDDVIGWDFVANDNSPSDESPDAHGTAIASVIGARGNQSGNGSGIAGVAWKVQIMPVRVIDGGNTIVGYTGEAIKGITYAIDNGADVINISWNFMNPFFPPLGLLFGDVFEYGASKGVTFIVSAPNDSYPLDQAGYLPAAFAYPNVISVGSSDANDQITSFTPPGKATVDLTAPGVDIVGANTNIAGWELRTGNSMAAAQVSGAVALMLAEKNDLTPGEIRSLLINSVDNLNFADTVSGGRLNLYSALNALKASTCQQYTATNNAHVSAGRAIACGFFNLYACAKGSGDNLGFNGSFVTTTLRETNPGYFEKGSCGVGTGALNIPPVITQQGLDAGEPITFVKRGNAWSDPGANAADREDGNLTNQITKTGSVDTNNVGTYYVTYQVNDSAGKAAGKESRIVRVVDDSDILVIWLVGQGRPTIIDQGGTYEEPGYFAWDFFYGDLTSEVVVAHDIDTSTIGFYPVAYSVTNAENLQASNLREVLVLGEAPLVYAPYGGTQQTIEQCQSGDYNPIQTKAYDKKDGDISSDIVQIGNFDFCQLGQQQISYQVTDSEGYSHSLTAFLTVTQGNTPPQIDSLEAALTQDDPNNPGKTLVQGFASDIDGNLSLVKVHNGNGFWVDATGTETFVVYFDSQPGAYTFEAQAFDDQGAASDIFTTNVIVNYPVAPDCNDLRIRKNPDNSATIEGDGFDRNNLVPGISETIFVDVSLAEGAWVPANVTPSSIGPGWFGYTYDTGILPQGNTPVKVRVTDDQGLSGDQCENTIIIGMPAKIDSLNVTVSGNNATYSGTASDEDGDLTGVEVKLDNGNWLMANGAENWSYTFTNLTDGQHTVSARAFDSVDRGTPVSVSQNFTIAAQQACVTSDNLKHISQGRAIQCGYAFFPSACAVGSGTNLGYATSYFNQTSSVKETSPGFWTKVSSCP